ncbi:ABC transporter substrate-binding protein [Nocardiopsis terrae]|uniref:Raffinose/stachyose/melibiose transport system substrate-binding protein n=1 Tax=Nocardiopsis terrae TaxID=372655 RepID=A0ABR9HG45_9ACTN|nr:extracellular solute-binding protein [Nocardiopsis terrae]MBE1457990.1 raffinose/stachyose/melibiose transport system substrate-binding protein [Nocardiopsis terrae]GHC83161.1 ABC transporter substrate-binding protein [Nocardiopsis terrae]
MSRRILAPLTCLAAAAALTACSADGGDGGDGLTVTANSTDRVPMDAVVAAFQEANPDTEVTVTYADTDQLQSTLRTQLSSGTAPDVFTVWPGNGNPAAVELLAPSGYLADLSDMEFTSRIPEGDRPVTEYEGATYVVPVTYSGIGVIYGKEALADLGAEEPTTWSELIDLCGTARDEGVSLLALGNQTPWVTQLVTYALAGTTVYADNPEFDEQMAAGEAAFADSGWQTAMEKYLEMEEEGCFNEDPLGTSYEASVSNVAQGDAVGLVQVATTLSQVQSEAGDTELGMFALPATDDADQTLMPGSVSAAYGLNAESADSAQATAFVEFLASPEAQDIYATEGGTLTALPDEDREIDPALTTLTEFQTEGRTVPFMDQRWPNPRVQQAHFTVVQQLFAGDVTVEEALTEMDEAYEAE